MSLLVFSLLLPACEHDSASYQYGEPLFDVTFRFYAEDEGIHPSTIVLDNPANPFSVREPALKWDIEEGSNPSARFYSWATQLAVESTGEHQFYTANALRDLHYLQIVPREERYALWQLTIDAYQSVLDNFPKSVSYTADQIAFPLAPLAYDEIIALGGEVQGGWIKTTGSNGQEIFFQNTDDSMEVP